MQDDITAETLAILPGGFKNADKAWKKHSVSSPVPHRSKQDFRKPDHKQDKDSGSMNNTTSQAMMMNNHAWYGDAFLFELLCQYKGYHPKEDNWFTSVYPFVAFETFCHKMFKRQKFYRSCILSIGYSDLFNAKALTGFPQKQSLHALLNYMNEHGATRIKVLSVPPARQMMKNVEYLKICQTTNKFLKAITKTHPFVDFINLDRFFMSNANDFFNYIDGNNEVQVQITDHLLMRKVNDHFEIFIEPEITGKIIDYLIEFTPSTKNYQTDNGFSGSYFILFF